MNNKLKPALLGGLIVGFLSAIHSLIPFVGACCCIWSIIGGVLAAFLYIKDRAVPVKLGDVSAIVGALAGVVGGVIYVVIYLPFALLYGLAAMQGAAEPERRANTVFGYAPGHYWKHCRRHSAGSAVDFGRGHRHGNFEKRKGDGLAPPPPQNFA